jgi:hypothetical protein
MYGYPILTYVTPISSRHECALHVPGRIAKAFAATNRFILVLVVRRKVGADVSTKTRSRVSTVDRTVLGDVFLTSASLNHRTCTHTGSISGCSVARQALKVFIGHDLSDFLHLSLAQSALQQ